LAAGKQWLTKAEYDAMSTNGASLFGDVKDFTFSRVQNKICFGAATSTEHQLSISGSTEKSGYEFP
jgi:hypothetical protein